MDSNTRVKLSVMMFLQFFIWGAWFVTLGTYLGSNISASGSDIGMAFGTQSWGAIIAPFFIGLIADRYFNAERILGVMHLIGAALMYFMAKSTSFEYFYPYVFLYMIAYMPTLALVNSIAFRQMSDPSKEFSLVRVFGTVGWIFAGLMISFVFAWDSTDAIAAGALSNTFNLAAIASLALGIFSFFLPKTPPVVDTNEKVSISKLLGLDALKMLNNRNFLIFFISSILICIPLAFYYQNANPFLVNVGMSNPTGMMTIGQISEIGFMLLLPIFFTKYGFKNTIMIGMLAWVVRYLLFGFGSDSTSLLILGIAMHGICYDFFFVSGQIYTSAKAGASNQSSAQGLITLATYGAGMLIGFWVAGQITTMYPSDWQTIWTLPAIFAAVVLILFFILFKDEQIDYKA